MRTIVYLGLSLAYATLAGLIWLAISFSCGMGPDALASCDATADSRATIFAGGALVVYGVLTIIYWHRRTGAR